MFRIRTLAAALCLGLASVGMGDHFYVQAPKTVLRSSDHLRIELHGITQPADVYLLTRINGNFLFVTQGPGLSQDPVPIATGVSGSTVLLDFPVGTLQGRYPAFVVVTRTGGDPFNVRDWLGWFDGLRRLLFHANVDLDGDRNGDGWLDYDHDHDGHYDDDFDGLPGVPGSGASLGAQLYAQNCAGCHGQSPDGRAQRAANDPDRIKNAIAQNRGGMGVLAGKLSDGDLAAIAAWIGQVAGGGQGGGGTTASGQQLYLNYCSSCHLADPTQDRRICGDSEHGRCEGTSLREIEEAIWKNKGGMGQLRGLIGTEILRKISDYLVSVVGFDT